MLTKIHESTVRLHTHTHTHTHTCYKITKEKVNAKIVKNVNRIKQENLVKGSKFL